MRRLLLLFLLVLISRRSKKIRQLPIQRNTLRQRLITPVLLIIPAVQVAQATQVEEVQVVQIVQIEEVQVVQIVQIEEVQVVLAHTIRRQLVQATAHQVRNRQIVILQVDQVRIRSLVQAVAQTTMTQVKQRLIMMYKQRNSFLCLLK